MKSTKTFCLTIFFLIFGHIVGSTMKPIVAMQETASQTGKMPSFSGGRLLGKQQNQEIDFKTVHKKRIAAFCFLLLVSLGFAVIPFFLGFFTVSKFLLSVLCILIAFFFSGACILGINEHVRLLKQLNKGK
jgi:Na+(H+)/acetate symporter ActP